MLQLRNLEAVLLSSFTTWLIKFPPANLLNAQIKNTLVLIYYYNKYCDLYSVLISPKLPANKLHL